MANECIQVDLVNDHMLLVCGACARERERCFILLAEYATKYHS
jgi:hypothetical protein